MARLSKAPLLPFAPLPSPVWEGGCVLQPAEEEEECIAGRRQASDIPHQIPPSPPLSCLNSSPCKEFPGGDLWEIHRRARRPPFWNILPPKATAGSKQKRSGLVLLFLTWKKAKVGRRLFSDYDSSTAAEGSRGTGVLLNNDLDFIPKGNFPRSPTTEAIVCS